MTCAAVRDLETFDRRAARAMRFTLAGAAGLSADEQGRRITRARRLVYFARLRAIRLVETTCRMTPEVERLITAQWAIAHRERSSFTNS